MVGWVHRGWKVGTQHSTMHYSHLDQPLEITKKNIKNACDSTPKHVNKQNQFKNQQKIIFSLYFLDFLRPHVPSACTPYSWSRIATPWVQDPCPPTTMAPQTTLNYAPDGTKSKENGSRIVMQRLGTRCMYPWKATYNRGTFAPRLRPQVLEILNLSLWNLKCKCEWMHHNRLQRKKYHSIVYLDRPYRGWRVSCSPPPTPPCTWLASDCGSPCWVEGIKPNSRPVHRCIVLGKGGKERSRNIFYNYRSRVGVKVTPCHRIHRGQHILYPPHLLSPKTSMKSSN